MNALPLARILIVDDEAAQMRALCDTLRDQGYETAGFTTGEEALKALQEKPFDLLLTDLMMPGMDGVALLTAALKIDSQLVGILMTGMGTIETAVQAMQAGALDYILKPFKVSAILPVLARALSVRRLRQENLELKNTVAIHELTQAIAYTLDPNVLLDKIADAALQQFEADEASIMLLADDGRSFQVAAVRGEGRDALLGTRVPLGEGIAGWVAARREPLVLEGEVRDARMAPRHPRAAIQSALSMPMITRDRLIGVININCIRKRRAFTLGRIKVLGIFTNAAAAGIEAARLYGQLRESEERLNFALHKSLTGGWDLDLADHTARRTLEHDRIFGYGSLLPQWTYEMFLEHVLPEDRAEVDRGFRAATAAQTEWDFQCRIRRADGEVRWIWATGEHQRDEAGQVRRMAGIVQDITERKQTERRIQGQLEHLNLLDHITRAIGERQDLRSVFQVVIRSLEDSLPIDFGCVCLYDHAANALRVTCVGVKSDALAHELTMDEQASIAVDDNGLGRCVQGQLVYEPDIGQVRFPFPERLARGGLGSLVMAPLRSESRVFGVLVAARREAQGFSSVECEFLRQLSEHVALAAHQAQLYGALQQAYDDLRQTQAAMMQEERLRALGQMASGIAHDINNALSPVSLYTESMLETERNLSERARGYLETIQRAVEDVAQTVASMREFYRPRETQLALTPVQMNSMVQQVVDLTRARWSDMPQQHGIMIRAPMELAPDLPKIMGVESEIREALTNLVFNAVDAMPEGGTLTLRTRVADADSERAAVVVEVADTGVGMNEETRRRCLEPFFTTKGERGTGLGLAMVFGVVQRHSAELEIETAPGAGTTVRLVFAVAAAVLAEAGRPAGAPEAPSRLRLLLIDDDPLLLKSLRDALETDGHVIVTANSGEAGIAMFRASLDRGEPFAAVITDLGMPYVDGRQVAAAVKEISPATPVIMLTGWGQRLVAEGDIPPHVDRVLAKPPKLRELREALAQLCRPEPS